MNSTLPHGYLGNKKTALIICSSGFNKRKQEYLLFSPSIRFMETTHKLSSQS